MIEVLTSMGYAIIGLAVMLGIGIYIVLSLSAGLANCSSVLVGGAYNSTSQLCYNSSTTSVPSTSASTMNTIGGYLGTSSGGLATWIPIVIIFVIGMLFLGAFMVKRGKTA